jgi:hypothetical protein
MIRKLIGFLTLPGNAEQCELGDWWVPYSGFIYTSVNRYPYRYQKLCQSTIGVWRKDSCWMGRYYDMDHYKGLRRGSD